MNKFINNIDKYIERYSEEYLLFKVIGKNIKKRGFLTKAEFVAICLWKSRRQKNRYLENTRENIEINTRKALCMNDEKSKIEILTQLHGVGVPTASAILTVIYPEKYGIIDVRCVIALKELDVIKWEKINLDNWIEYLKIIRELANQSKRTPREIEMALFAYNRIELDKESKNLYK